jgi:hypothetical protein
MAAAELQIAAAEAEAERKTKAPFMLAAAVGQELS